MKIAIIHDYIKEFGGAERVLLALCEVFPEAAVFTSVYHPQYLGKNREKFQDINIKTSFAQNFPLSQKLISPIRVLSPWIFENFDLSQFDVVIVSATGAYIPNLILKDTDTLHITYCHTPPRYLYGYPTARNWNNNPIGKILGSIINHKLRQIDFISYQRPDYIIANSEEVKKRINKFYRREAIVIYPPIDIELKKENFKPVQKRKYYLAGGRLARAKQIHLTILACKKLKKPLKIFGRDFAGYENELKEIAGKNTEFLGEVSDRELQDLYNNAKALIFPSSFEDFGIIPVEAQSRGTPVIALKSGGVKESVVDGETGIFFEEPSVESVMEAIKKFEKSNFDPRDCVNNVKRFSKDRFKKEIKKYILNKYAGIARS